MPRKPANLPVPVPPAPPPARVMGTDVVRVDAVYHVPSVHPKQEGPWSGEADKVAWTDPATGYPCIIRREATNGYLCGYVAVPPGHPLHGLGLGSLYGLHILVHGGLGYAETCRRWEPEQTSICHVPRPYDPARPDRDVLYEGSTGALTHRPEDDAWWFGFACDGLGDVLPTATGREKERHEDGLHAPVYRNEAYVYRECVHLASQLHLIGTGRSALEAGPPPSAAPEDRR